GLVAAELHQIRFVHLHDVDVVNKHLADGRLDQTVDMPDQSRFSRPGKPHDDLNAPAGHRDVDILQAQYVRMLLHQSGLGHSSFDGLDKAGRPVAEDFVKMLDLDAVADAVSHGPSPCASATGDR